MAHLGVNLDHVATLRQARGGVDPEPVAAAVLVELAGADGIVVHLREDRRHIQDRDLRLLKQTIKIKLDLEMAATSEMIKVAQQIKPQMVTLVPEKRMELTTEGGLDLIGHKDEIQKAVATLKDAGIAVSLFIEPDAELIKVANKIQADCVELHTGKYANSRTELGRKTELETLANAAKLSARLGLGVNAGHGLNYVNIKPVARIGEIEEFNIGHGIVARAVMVGMERAVREMIELVK